MFICHNPKFVYVSFTKSGSSSIYKLLEANFSGQRLRRTKKLIDEQYNDYLSFCVVRNPYSRLVSWWWSICNTGGDRYGHKKELLDRGLSLSLEDFLTVWVEKNGTSQIRPISFDYILKLENIEDDFNSLPFITKHINIPRSNAKNRPHWKELINTKSIQLINTAYKRDFELLGYEMIEEI